VDVSDTILDTIGHTPLVRLNKVTDGIAATVLAKLEFMNPGGSVKDRIGTAMIDAAEKVGLLKPGGTIIEPTSGNTGVGLALVAALRGYRVTFTIPDKMAQEKINLLKAFGARVVVCPTAVPPDHPDSYYKVAERIHSETPNSFLPNQYTNQNNPQAHYLTTGPEIWEQTDGKITHFVCGIGTGGTISGVGKYLKEQSPSVKVIGVDPYGSIIRDFFYTGEKVEPHTYKVEGIGEDIIPETTHFRYIDEVLKVGDNESFLMARRLSREEGLLVGGSSGTAVVAALRVARNLDEEAVVVVLLPDTGERYLSKVHSDEWMREHGFLEEEMAPLMSILNTKEEDLPPVVTLRASDPVAVAVERMRHHNISQIPVMEGGIPVGSVREDALMQRLVEKPSLHHEEVREVMDEPFPMVGPNADLEAVAKLLQRGNPAVLVGSEERVEGIVTRIDVIEYLARKGG
jgi:cystathionine beta-synthase